MGSGVEGEDLGERALRGDQAPCAQPLTGLGQCRAGQGQALAPRRSGGVPVALGIRHGAQREGEGAGLRAALIERALTDQALSHPTALLGDASECGWRKGAFGPPGSRLEDGVDPRA